MRSCAPGLTVPEPPPAGTPQLTTKPLPRPVANCPGEHVVPAGMSPATSVCGIHMPPTTWKNCPAVGGVDATGNRCMPMTVCVVEVPAKSPPGVNPPPPPPPPLFAHVVQLFPATAWQILSLAPGRL